jgi:hypothetical protein
MKTGKITVTPDWLIDIPWYEWLYVVTPDWKVWSYPKFAGIFNKWAKRLNAWRFLKQGMTTSGYPQVILRKDKKSFNSPIHRIMAITFLPNIENKKTVNHKNGIRTDNRVENLEWSTYSENIWHSYKELGRKSTIHIASKTREKKIAKYDKNDNLIATYLSVTVASCANKINRGHINCCALWRYGRKTAWGFIWKFI